METLIDLIQSFQIPFGSEQQMQDTIERILKAESIKFSREHVFSPRDRIDFLVGRIGLECKTAGSPSKVLGQLLRYAERPEIDGLLLVTSRHTHAFDVRELGNKPFRMIRVIGL